MKMLPAAISLLFLALVPARLPAQESPAGENARPADATDETAAAPATETQVSPSLARVIFSLDPLKKKGPDEKKWSFSLGGGLQTNFGNTDNIIVNGAARFDYDNGITDFSASYETFYGEDRSQVNEHRGMGVVNLDHFVHPRVEIFAFSSGEYNEMSRLVFRNNTGAGAKLVFFRNRYWIPDLSLAPIYQYQKFSALAEKHEARASLRFRVRITPLDWLLYQYTLFYVPAFDDGENYRLSMDLFGQVQVKSFTLPGARAAQGPASSGLYFIAGYKRNFNNRVPAGTFKLDQNIYARVAIKL
jgi:hypothetical protein